MRPNYCCLKKKPYTVLFVEDDKHVRDRTSESLSMVFNKVYVAEDGLEALELLHLHQIDIVISDINMPNMNGVDLIKEIRTERKKLPIIVTTGYNEFEEIYDNIYNIETLTKPYTLFDIINIVEKMQDNNKLIEECEMAYTKLEEGYEEAKKALKLLDGDKG